MWYLEGLDRINSIMYFEKYSETLLKLLYDKKGKHELNKRESRKRDIYLIENWIILLQYGFKKFMPFRYGYRFGITPDVLKLYASICSDKQIFTDNNNCRENMYGVATDIKIKFDDNPYLTVADCNVLFCYVERLKFIIIKCMDETIEYQTLDSYKKLTKILKLIHKLSKDEEELYIREYLAE